MNCYIQNEADDLGTINVNVVKKQFNELTNLTTCQELRKHT